uniref:Sorting nexin-2 n=1 Tax=Esox lucius TaxID=8010 RepID=A0A6Q2YWZ3_ESOLU
MTHGLCTLKFRFFILNNSKKYNLEQKCEGDLTKPVNVFHSTGDGMNAYMAYKVSTQTTLPMFRSKMFTVRRRFSDFLGLYEKLLDKHAQSGYIVPPPPEKSIMGMTKVKVGKEDNSSAEFVEKRRAALERYLQRVVCHPSLLQDPDVREFLERDDMPRAHSTQALSGAGFLKMINRATDAVSKMTIKMNESDVWFEDKLLEVEAEDQQLRKLHIMVESLVGHRKELSVNTAGFAKSVAMLGSSEDNTALSRALSQLAEVEDKMEQLHQDQAASDSFCLAELLADYIRLLGSVRASFDQRMKTWQRWQDAQNMLQKKRETEAKLLWANKPDKLQQAKDEITEWEAKVTQYEKDFDRVSSTVRKEVLRFEKEKARDFKKQIIKYLESLLQSQQQVEFWTLVCIHNRLFHTFF